jgi:hypothetical protein
MIPKKYQYPSGKRKLFAKNKIMIKNNRLVRAIRFAATKN